LHMESLNLLLSEIRPAVMSADRFFSILSVSASDMFGGMIWSFVQFIAATIFVAILAYYVTKRMFGARGAAMGRNGGNLAIVESVNVGGQAIIQLVKAGDKYLVIGVTKERITMLSELSAEQITEFEAPDSTGLNSPFGKILSRFMPPKDEPVERDGDSDNDSE